MEAKNEINGARLNIAAGIHKGKVIELNKTPFIIGRGVDCDYVDIGPGVSREHCVLRRECGSWTIEDTGSSNGIVVNGQKIKGKIRLYYHDRVAMGEMGFVFEDPENKMLNPHIAEKQKIEVITEINEKGGSVTAFLISCMLLVAAIIFTFHTLNQNRQNKIKEQVNVREVIKDKIIVEQEKPDILPDLVFFDTTPPGATVTLNGQVIGKTPLPMTDGYQKINHYQLYLEGYEMRKGSLVFPADKPKLSFELKQKKGTFLLTSEKPGISIYHGEMLIGKTPLLLNDWEPGRYELKFNDYGYSSKTEKIEINQHKASELKIVLKAYTCQISIISNPPNCSVYIDDLFMGKTKASDDRYNVRSAPLLLTGIRPGAHTVRVVSHDGKEYKWKIKKLTDERVYKIFADLK